MQNAPILSGDVGLPTLWARVRHQDSAKAWLAQDDRAHCDGWVRGRIPVTTRRWETAQTPPREGGSLKSVTYP